MSKFQSFASQGSYRDYLLQAPDETAKIKEETARTIQGKERAQRFLEGNNALYLQAQKLAQEQEQLSRETNFQLETQNRKFYRDALDRDFRIQAENDRIAGEQLQNTYKQLGAFSQTASNLFVEFNKKITENQTNANTVNTLLAGTTFEENLAIQGMVNNLTEAEFAQQDFIKAKVAEGKDAKALWALYNNRNTRGFIENAGVIQNTSNAAAPFLQEVLSNLDPNLTPEQKRLQVETAWREWLSTSFKDANGKQLNPKLVATLGSPIFGRAYTNVMGELDREIDKANKEKLKQDTFAGYDTALLNGGVAGITKEYQDGHLANLGKQTRDNIADWMIARLEAGTMTPAEAQAIIDAQYEGPNKTMTSWAGQHPTDPNLGKVNETIRKIKRGVIADAQLEEQQRKLALDAELTEAYNQRAVDGSVSDKDYLELQEIAAKAGLPGYTSPILEQAYKERDTVRFSAAATSFIQDQYSKGNLTKDFIDSLPLTGEAREKAYTLLERQKKQRDNSAYKPDIDAIKNAITSIPGIVNKNDPTVLLMQDKFVQEYKSILSRTDNHEEARALTMKAIQNRLTVQGAVTPDGKFASIVAEEKKFAQQGEASLQAYKAGVRAAQNSAIRNDPVAFANSLGATFVYQTYDNMKAGKPASQQVKNLAALMKMTPLDFVNYIASGARNKEMPPITVSPLIEQIRENMAPLTKRLYANPTNERIRRANAINTGNGLSTAPTRGDEISKFRAAIIAKESGGSYTIVNPDSGAIGIGQVMPENVGPWTQRYLGRTLTPEQFRYDPGAQDAVVNGRFRDMLADQRAAGYKGEEMIRRAAAVWYSGRGDLWNNTTSQYYNGRRYPSIAEYTLSIWKKFQSSY